MVSIKVRSACCPPIFVFSKKVRLMPTMLLSRAKKPVTSKRFMSFWVFPATMGKAATMGSAVLCFSERYMRSFSLASCVRTNVRKSMVLASRFSK